jgi:hypothetical protein
MNTFEDRERSFEKKFALDQELRFKAEARRAGLAPAEIIAVADRPMVTCAVCLRSREMTEQ